MKTTIEVDDELFRQAKVLAAQRGITLRELLQAGLKLAMAEEMKAAARARIKLPLIRAADNEPRLTTEAVCRAVQEAEDEEAEHSAHLMRR